MNRTEHLIGQAIHVARPQGGAFANKADPFHHIRGTVAGPVSNGRIPVTFRSGRRTVTQMCSLATVRSIGGNPTPWSPR